MRDPVGIRGAMCAIEQPPSSADPFGLRTRYRRTHPGAAKKAEVTDDPGDGVRGSIAVRSAFAGRRTARRGPRGTGRPRLSSIAAAGSTSATWPATELRGARPVTPEIWP